MTDHVRAPVVRPLQESDWTGLWPLLVGMGVHGDEGLVRRRFIRLLHARAWHIWGAEIDGALAGYAALQDYGSHLRSGDEHRTARLHDVFVRDDRRRSGVGRALMAAVMVWADGRVRHLEWQASAERSATFYERLGYQGDRCPQPEYPYFEVTFEERLQQESRTT